MPEDIHGAEGQKMLDSLCCGDGVCVQIHGGIVGGKEWKLLDPLYCETEVYMKMHPGWDGGVGVESASLVLWEWSIQAGIEGVDEYRAGGAEEMDVLDGHISHSH